MNNIIDGDITYDFRKHLIDFFKYEEETNIHYRVATYNTKKDTLTVYYASYNNIIHQELRPLLEKYKIKELMNE